MATSATISKPRTEHEALAQYEALAHRITRNFHRRYSHYHAYEDLLQEANLAIVKAYRTFSPKRSAFMTHVYNTIRFALSKFVQKHTGLVHVPYKRVSAGAALPQCVDIESCRPVGDHDVAMGGVESHMSYELIVAGLEDREKNIMELIYRDGRSAFDISVELGMTKKEVLAVHRGAIAKMREACDAFGVGVEDLRAVAGA